MSEHAAAASFSLSKEVGAVLTPQKQTSSAGHHCQPSPSFMRCHAEDLLVLIAVASPRLNNVITPEPVCTESGRLQRATPPQAGPADPAAAACAAASRAAAVEAAALDAACTEEGAAAGISKM